MDSLCQGKVVFYRDERGWSCNGATPGTPGIKREYRYIPPNTRSSEQPIEDATGNRQGQEQRKGQGEQAKRKKYK